MIPFDQTNESESSGEEPGEPRPEAEEDRDQEGASTTEAPAENGPVTPAEAELDLYLALLSKSQRGLKSPSLPLLTTL